VVFEVAFRELEEGRWRVEVVRSWLRVSVGGGPFLVLGGELFRGIEVEWVD